ncbi:hypothetical protein A2362_00805 [Candidatus Curtissbacteria bacterium RIFOXYB1_FULL_41_59]|uniref:Uncharacterized protein n=1 Tax=Candidatus Curtissbacteria bacterium RIFOXYA1_FULL_41_14 TaxID=1797737 RepID=A0A1F5HBZ9_9BACT|nr:MAG: hypothetical protein US48_C0029G0003 [Candidatus Levybacteria bacterium GW2011_GWA2_37_36]KKR56036.1 MAG: hypothetical protein UT95_C0056G0003 [Candidatus Curtissbacteria bacterium GW2011_GWB1_40_28]KKR76939.1 MAG: hypothetical protein UU19_C0020G0006 [Candidatus Curtissbacteria bacterium GW2011_GWD1_40_8]KKS01883.1 MAG: hypothetical protein UU53_C0006G0015 [Candidatus Curtissbacteria bacterium GW2011_GWC2_41_21]OGD79824.1 MAG: hypothetical protein A2683_00115 [Candidatus Curtissbacteri
MILKIIYSIFIGVLFAVLVGVGIAAFYPEPKPPEYPSALKIPREGGLNQPVFNELKGEQEEFDRLEKAFEQNLETYNRNVSIIAIVASIITLVVSLTLFGKLLLIADGLLLGGVLTLLYSIIRGFGSGNNKFQFIIVSLSFTVALILGYIKLAKPPKA